MPKKIHCPTADELSLLPRRAPSRRAALAEARELALWARKRIPIGSAAEILTHGHHVSYDEDVNLADLDLGIAMIVARVREDTTAKLLRQQWDRAKDASWNGFPLRLRIDDMSEKNVRRMLGAEMAPRQMSGKRKRKAKP